MSLSIPGKPKPGITLQKKLESIQKFHQKIKSTTRFYYKQEYAEAAKDILERLHEKRLPLRIRAEDVSVGTLKLQFYQGCDYLLDFLDPTGRYAKLKEQTKCSGDRDYIEFRIRRTFKDRTIYDDASAWKDEFIAFIENAIPNDKLYIENISLAEEDISWIKTQLLPLVKIKDNTEIPLFYGQVEKNKILLIRDEN